jgi:hypothetical protein
MRDADGSGDAAVWVLDAAGWSRVPSPRFNQPGGQHLTDVATGPDGTIVTVGVNETSGKAIAFVAHDPTSWSKASVHADPGMQWMNSVTYLPDAREFVAGGKRTDAKTGDVDAAIWVSTDGTRWEAQLGDRTSYELRGGDRPLEIRSVVPYDRQPFDALAFGIEGTDMQAEAKLWNGYPTGPS